MKDSAKQAIRQTLATYLEQSQRRKTPERFAVLETICNFPSFFSMQQLGSALEENKFHVSRTTLYNTMNLLVQLHIVASHRLCGSTVYEIVYNNANQCRQICTVCGKVSTIKSPLITNAIEQTHLKRFRKEAFTLSIYGVCSTCLAKMTRKKNKNKT